MKSNLKSILVTMVVVSLLFNVGTVYAANLGSLFGADSGALGTILNLGGGVVTALIGQDPIVHGLIGAGFSAYQSYTALDQNLSIPLKVDRVNISDRQQEFIDDRSYEALVINPDKEIILTDQNVLDVDFKVTVKDLKTYENTSKNPNMRLTEKTEVIKVLDSNNQPTDGQRRGILFDDANLTIKDAYEYRTLLVKYKEARYDRQPVNLVIEAGEIINWGWVIQFFNTGWDRAKTVMKDKIFTFDITKNRHPEMPVEKTQKFHLLFNSRVDDNETDIDLSLLDCTAEDGSILGTTGTEVLPRVVYNWDFKPNNTVIPITGNETAIKNNVWCDVAENGIYCDSTQLTIEVLQKINAINQFVSTNSGTFTCPVSAIDQELTSDINNVGLTYLKVEDITSSGAEIIYKIRGNYQHYDPITDAKALFDINYIVTKKSENSFNWITIARGSVPVDQEYLESGGNQEGTIDIEFTEEPLETDTIKITVFLTNFHTTIANHEIGNNLLDNTLELQTDILGGTIGCSIPKTSANLVRFNTSFDEKLYNFKAYLMKDGYSEDFRKDFDDYYRFTFMQDTPQWYGSADSLTTTGDYTPLYKYFKDTEKFQYLLTNSGSEIGKTLTGPGRHNIKIMIYYDNQWKLFDDAGNLTGKIEVIIDKDQGPEQDSPLYYMPLDGLVGSTGDKTRNGYGVDYLNDKVPIFLDAQANYSGAMFTEGYISSNTVSTVDTKEVKEFATMNNGNERGKLLSIDRSQNDVLKLRYIPSRPTPVVLKVSNNAVNTNAYAFYKLSVGLPIDAGGEVATPGMSLAYWTGFANCNDFTGVPLLERFKRTPDLVSTESQLAPPTQSQSHAYGVEWRKEEIVRTGNVWMYTIFYTPSNFRTGSSTSHLYSDSPNDSLMFYSLNSFGSRSQGNFNSSSDHVELKNSYAQDIQSITDIFDLVTQKKACINFDNQSLEVFYNPKEISTPLTNAINSKIEAEDPNTATEFSCIKN